MIRLYIFRHGETDWNKDGRLQGWRDIPLDDQGRQQARQLAEMLLPFGIEFVIISNLSRAKETTAVVVERLGIPIEAPPAVRKILYGENLGRLSTDV